MICFNNPHFDIKKLELYAAILLFVTYYFYMLVAYQEYVDDRCKKVENNNQISNGQQIPGITASTGSLDIRRAF
jgi:hypothetical protein